MRLTRDDGGPVDGVNCARYYLLLRVEHLALRQQDLSEWMLCVEYSSMSFSGMPTSFKGRDLREALEMGLTIQTVAGRAERCGRTAEVVVVMEAS